MKILWVCGSRVVGGAERATLQLAELWRAGGHAVDTLCLADSDLELALGRLHLAGHRAPLGGSLNLRAPLAIAHAVRRIAPDVALVTTVDEWVWACLATRPRTPLVLVRHMALRLPWVVRWLAGRRAAAVVAVSEAVRDSLAGRARIPAERVQVIRNPVRFPPHATVPTVEERARARAALGLDPGGFWVGFFGGLSRRKGVEDACKAVCQANGTLGHTNLLICGRQRDGADGSPLADLIRQHGLEGRVHDIGETDDVQVALTAVDVVIMPTRRVLREALPLTLMEAMACGTPVLGYATGGIPEVIGTDGNTGRLALPDDVRDLGRVLVELLSDFATAQRLAANALVRVRTLFDPREAATRYEQLFASIQKEFARR